MLAMHLGDNAILTKGNTMTSIANNTAKDKTTLPLDIEYLGVVEGTLSEWIGEADEEASCGLFLERAHDAG